MLNSEGCENYFLNNITELEFRGYISLSAEWTDFTELRGKDTRPRALVGEDMVFQGENQVSSS